MPSAQDIYDTLVKDPDFEIGEHQTREEAAQVEAEYRTRQHWNNVKALSLANEPLKNSSSIKALLNHVYSITKTVVVDSISIVQNILKEAKQTVGTLVETYENQSFFDQYPMYHAQFITLPKSAQQLFHVLEKSKMPVGDLVKAFTSIHNTYQEEKAKFIKPSEGEEGSGIDPDDDSWVHGIVEAITETSGEGSFAHTIGIGAQYSNKIHAGLEAVLDEQGDSVFQYSISPKGAFKEASYKANLAGFYGENKKADLTKVATLEGINNALEKAGFPHRVGMGTGSKLKLTEKTGANIQEGAYHNPFPSSSHGRLYTSMVNGDAPTSATDNITFNNLESFSIADILNSINYLTEQTSPDEQEEYATEKAEVEKDLEVADEAEKKVLENNPPTVPNQAGKSPKAAKLSGEKAHKAPHVMMDAMMFGSGATQAGTAFNEALKFGVCDHKGRVNKIGMALLQDAYKKGVLNNKHVFQTATHVVVKAPGLLRLLEHHGIDLVHGKEMAKEVAEHISGQALAFEDMPEGIDWETLAKQVSGEIPVGGADEIPPKIISDAETATGVDAEPKLVGNQSEAFEAKATSHASRFTVAMNSGNQDAIKMAFGKIEGFISNIAKHEDFAGIPGSTVSRNNGYATLLSQIYEKGGQGHKVWFKKMLSKSDTIEEMAAAGDTSFWAASLGDDWSYDSISYHIHKISVQHPSKAPATLAEQAAEGAVEDDEDLDDYEPDNEYEDYDQDEDLGDEESTWVKTEQQHLETIANKSKALNELAHSDAVSEDVHDAQMALSFAIDAYHSSPALIDSEDITDVKDVAQIIKDNILPEYHDWVFSGLAGGPDKTGITQVVNASAFEQYVDDEDLVEPRAADAPSKEELKNDIGKKAQNYADYKGTDVGEKTLNILHAAMKGAQEFGLSAKDINDAVKQKIVDHSNVDLLDEAADAPKQPEQDYLNKYKALQDKIKKLHDTYEDDYTGSGLSDEEIAAVKDLASQNMKQEVIDFAGEVGAQKASQTAHSALGLLLGTDSKGTHDWLETNGLTNKIWGVSAKDTSAPPKAEAVPEVLKTNKITLQNHIANKAQKYTDQKGTDTEQQALDSLHTALEIVTNPKNAHITPLSAKEANDAIKDTLTDYSGITLLDEEAPTAPKEEAVPVDEAITALLDANKDVIEHTYNQTYGKDNPVVSLEDFTEDLKEKYSEMGEKKAKHEMAVAYKKQADFLAQEEQKATKAQEVADAKATAKDEKDTDQKTKAQEKTEAQEQKEQATQDKAAEKAATVQAKADAKDIEKNANSLPSDPGDLDQIAQDMDEDVVGEPLATQYARELMAHLNKYDKDMEPKTKKALLKALHEAAAHGADYETIEKEKQEMGDDFGSPEHLADARKQAAQRAEFHENHKELVSGTDPASVQARTEAMNQGKHDKFTEFDEDGNPIKEEGEEEEPDAVKHHVLHSLTPIQQKHVDDMKKSKAAGDEDGYKKAVKALEDSGIPIQDIEHSGDDAPKTGPPDPEVAKRKMGEGYVWHEETRSWILKTTLEELKGMHTGGASGLVGGKYKGSQDNFDKQTGEPVTPKPFAVNEDETPSTQNFFHGSGGHLIGVGDGKHTGSGAVSSSKLTQDVVGHKLDQAGHSEALKNSPTSYVQVNQGTPTPTPPPSKPSKGLWGKFKAEYQAGKQSKLGVKDTFLSRFKELNKEYPMPDGTALEYFLKEYGIGDHLKSKNKVRELVERFEEDSEKKSVKEGIII